jgi:hypothetical protein
MSDVQHAQRASSAERMRRSRELRRKGLRHIGLDVRETEIAELVRRQLLAENDRHDREAIGTALGRLLDMIFAGERRQDEGERSPAAPVVSWDENLR